MAEAAHSEAEQAASQLQHHLQTGGELTPIHVPDLALDDGETAYADVLCTTARYYGTEIVYPHAPAGYFKDHPTFGRRWVPNHRLNNRRRHEAEAEAQERWRDHAPARVVLTSDGLRIHPEGSPPRWLPFDHALLNNVSFRSGVLEVVLSYNVCAPILLAGPAAPWLRVAIEHIARI
ncbi:hypothetical protein [Streptomyces paludis]|uniref:Uncharacterized protein n=1 Tax=Streptomyces paludis TaxID=2282738 RepID=A0A345I125_9ACTN|nr:hypothetical protein [Streptomyces paludis]AXG82649.1 hypothetical protein DVK44_16765 [Streptomyces paludis]